MRDTVLIFCVILLISTSFVHTVTIVPNGSKTTRKDGVTHQTTKYIIIPENSNIVYEKDNLEPLLHVPKEYNDNNTNLYEVNKDSVNQDIKHGVKHHYGKHNNHHHRHHHHSQNNLMYYQTHGFTPGGRVKSYQSKGIEQSSSLSHDGLKVPEKTAHHVSYKMKPEKIVDKYEVVTGNSEESNTYKNVKSTFVPTKTVTYDARHQYKSGRNENNAADDSVDLSPGILRNSNDDDNTAQFVTYDESNNNSVQRSDNDKNINLQSDGISPQSNHMTKNNQYMAVDENYKLGHNFDYADKNVEKSIKVTRQYNDNVNNIAVASEKMVKAEVKPVNTAYMDDDNDDGDDDNNNDDDDDNNSHDDDYVEDNNDDDNHYDKNERDVASGKKTSKLGSINALRSENLNSYSNSAGTSKSLDTDPNPEYNEEESLDNLYDLIDINFDPSYIDNLSYTELEDRSLAFNGVNNVNNKLSNSKNNLEYYTDSIWEPNTVNGKTQTVKENKIGDLTSSSDFINLNERPGAETSNKANARYNTINSVQEPSTINTGSNTIHSEFQTDKTNSMYAPLRKINSLEESTVPVESSHHSVVIKHHPKNILKLYNYYPNRHYKNGFVTINGEKYNIDENLLRYIMSQKQSDSFDDHNAKAIFIINDKKYILNDKVLKYILSHKQSNAMNEQNGKILVTVNGKTYAIDKNVLRHILLQRQSNLYDEKEGKHIVIINSKKYVLNDNEVEYIFSHSQSNTLDGNIGNVFVVNGGKKYDIDYSPLQKKLFHIIENDYISDGSKVDKQYDRKIEDIIKKQYQQVLDIPYWDTIYKSNQIKKMHTADDKSTNLLDNKDQVIDDRVLKYIITKRPGNTWHAKYVMYKNPYTETMEEHHNIDSNTNMINLDDLNIDLSKDINSDRFNFGNVHMNINKIDNPLNNHDIILDVTRKTAVEAKYNLAPLKQFLLDVAIKTKVDSVENMNAFYNDVLNLIVLLDSRGVSDQLIAQLIRKIHLQVLRVVTIASEGQNPYNYLNLGNLCSLCHQ